MFFPSSKVTQWKIQKDACKARWKAAHSVFYKTSTTLNNVVAVSITGPLDKLLFHLYLFFIYLFIFLLFNKISSSFLYFFVYLHLFSYFIHFISFFALQCFYALFSKCWLFLNHKFTSVFTIFFVLSLVLFICFLLFLFFVLHSFFLISLFFFLLLFLSFLYIYS